MANRDYESNFGSFERNGGNSVNPNFDMPQFNGKFIFSQSDNSGDPRQQSFFGMLKQVFCPRLTLCSFTSIIVTINISVFILTCMMGIDKQGSLLQIDYDTLKAYGNLPQSVYDKNQFWRWFTSCFLHADFMHLFFNSICTMVVCSMIERGQGALEVFLVYIISGICGNVFSSVIGDDPSIVSVGASTCIYGSIAALIGYMILNWEAMAVNKQARNLIMCVLCVIIVLIIFMSMGPTDGGNATLDFNGHIGGFIGGLFFSLCIFSPMLQPKGYEKTCKGVGAILGCFYLGLLLTLFYTTKFS